jgi:hypothetical protein
MLSIFSSSVSVGFDDVRVVYRYDVMDTSPHYLYSLDFVLRLLLLIVVIG